MRQIQSTVLNPIELGKTPVFIIGPHSSDGAGLAMLLSDNLEIRDMDEFSDSFSSHEHNYFNNSECAAALKRFKSASYNRPEEARSVIKFLLEIGFDTNKLWGVLCCYEDFFELQLSTLFPDSFFAFVYDDKFGSNDYSNKITEFLSQNQKTSFSVHVDNVFSIPEIVLKTLPIVNPTLKIKEVKPAYGVKNLDETDEKNLLSVNEKSSRDKIEEFNLLVKYDAWYSGEDILYILVISSVNFNEDLLFRKFSQLKNSFSKCPELYTLCSSELVEKKLLRVIEGKVSGISITNLQSSTDLNNVIQSSSCAYVVLDDSSLSHQITDILLPFKNERVPVFTFAAPLDSDTEELSFQDMLIRVLNVDNLTFSRKTYLETPGFEVQYSYYGMLWDFIVKSLQVNGGNVIAVNTTVVVDDKNRENGKIAEKKKDAFDEIKPDDFEKIFDKYASLFVDNLQFILLKSFNQTRLSTYQLNKFNKKIDSQLQVINQSIDEVKSVTELNLSMQKRIYTLESKWYYKLDQKLKHFKGIFFKKSTSGTSGFKKIIKFILFTFSRPGFRILRKIAKGILKRLYLYSEDRPVNIIYLDSSEGNIVQEDYNAWIRKKLDPVTLQAEYDNEIDKISKRPTVSVIMPVYNPELSFLKDAIESVISQSYENWELCIADDCSPNPQIQRLLNSYAMKDKRIKVELRETNGHISACTNSALALAEGEYVLLLDHDDVLTTNCLFEVVKHINENPDDELIYSDEDKMLSSNVFVDPFFKPDWSPDKLMATNYVSHVAVIKRSLIHEVGGFRLGFEGSQDYDLMLRCTEKAKSIGHIPKILYHWRIHELSVAGNTDVKPYAYIAGKKALEEALVRRNLPGEVQYTSQRGRYRIKYKIRKEGKVSIIIPTKDATDMMKNTIDSILSLTEYPNYEIIVLNNNSTSKAFFDLMKFYTEKHKDIFRCVDASFPFNFSKLMNLGSSLSTGEYILMLNNDVEILKGDWITWMVAYCQNEPTGAVGVKLLYPDDTIQHAGTVIGLGDDKVAAHAFVGYHKNATGYFNKLQFVSNYAALTAACLMVRKSVYDEVGGMDEALEVEYNDVDFCLKLIDSGYYNIYLPDVVLYHYESATRGHPSQDKKSYERHVREIKYFRSKWNKYIKNDPFYNPNFSLDNEGFRVDFSD